ncbi:hypothetical protein K443DRAFT_673984 [Laccaria amethystina LaAM-08-1]|uniref:Unplaced genomic scaffold K443scaffold_16, whole genome shotgun sequence n=1 Tax=Laccaria amethystina LaAM-08-1 TaxID=1095629 RepID=A0A0C9Y8X6_9AGAR|nr:hypothetical protein K443DRAFT_673984 [Laccaria amethystina LaAM-08-1]
MPAAKSKAAPSANGAAKAKTASSSGTATPVSTADKKDVSDALATFASGKPDKKAYDVEQDKIKAEIDALQIKLTSVRDKIGSTTKSGPGNDHRNALRAELDSIRDKQSANKTSRGKVLDQLKSFQDGVQKKIKDLQTAKTKIPFRTVAEVDAHIKNLEKQVESGNMKLAEEKRALQEISSSRRNRRAVEGFQAEQESIEALRHSIDELKKQLDDPESKAVSERYDAIKAELDELKREGDEAYAGRSKLFEERDNLQSEIKNLFNEKRDSTQQFRDANDRYWNKVNEDRARRAERARLQRAAEEAQKKQDLVERIREEAQVPAFQAHIEDCQTLIDYFSGKSNVAFKSASLSAKAEVAGVPKLDIRKVKEVPEGLVALNKKGKTEDAYFVGGKGKGKGKKGQSKENGLSEESTAASPSSANTTLNVPLPTLSALLSLSIPPPASSVDVPRIIEDLKTKKTWFEANQARVTAENISKAEADIRRLMSGTRDLQEGSEPSEGVTPNASVELPAEPAPTPQVGSAHVPTFSSEEVLDKLEIVQDEQAEASTQAI